MLISFACFLLYNHLFAVLSAPIPPPECPHYAQYARQRHDGELPAGRYQLPFQRPTKICRTYRSEEVEDAIERLKPKIADPDLRRLFENSFPNTLDTTVRWKGFAWANGSEGTYTDEDLAFVITGDMYVVRAYIASHYWLIVTQRRHVATRLCQSDPFLPPCPPNFL